MNANALLRVEGLPVDPKNGLRACAAPKSGRSASETSKPEEQRSPQMCATSSIVSFDGGRTELVTQLKDRRDVCHAPNLAIAGAEVAAARVMAMADVDRPRSPVQSASPLRGFISIAARPVSELQSGPWTRPPPTFDMRRLSTKHPMGSTLQPRKNPVGPMLHAAETERHPCRRHRRLFQAHGNG